MKRPQARAAALEAVALAGGDVGARQAVRRAFVAFRRTYRPGAGVEDLRADLAALLEDLQDALDPDTFTRALILIAAD